MSDDDEANSITFGEEKWSKDEGKGDSFFDFQTPNESKIRSFMENQKNMDRRTGLGFEEFFTSDNKLNELLNIPPEDEDYDENYEGYDFGGEYMLDSELKNAIGGSFNDESFDRKKYRETNYPQKNTYRENKNTSKSQFPFVQQAFTNDQHGLWDTSGDDVVTHKNLKNYEIGDIGDNSKQKDINPNLKQLFANMQISGPPISPPKHAMSLSQLEAKLQSPSKSNLDSFPPPGFSSPSGTPVTHPRPSHPREPPPFHPPPGLPIQESGSNYPPPNHPFMSTPGSLPPLSELLSPHELAQLERLPMQEKIVFMQNLRAHFLQQQHLQQQKKLESLQQTNQHTQQTSKSPQPQQRNQPQNQPNRASPIKSGPVSRENESNEEPTDKTLKALDDPNQQMKRRTKWKQSKTLMLADDIDAIIKIQESQLHSDNPFLEDYYYQNFMKKYNSSLVSADIIFRHRPICECFKPAGTPKKRTGGKDPLEGALGRTSGSTARAPRPLVELKSEPIVPLPIDDVKIEGVNDQEQDGNNLESTAATFARSIMTRTDGLSSLPRILLLTIETAMSAVLEIEDLDLILSSIASDQNDTRFNRHNILEKRIERTNLLFSSLKINLQSPPPTGNVDGFYSKEDEFFVRVITVNKGVKMLCRALPLLFPNQIIQVIYVIMRNLHIIVHLPSNDEEDQRLKTVFRVVVAELSKVTFVQIITCFQLLLALNYTNAAPPALKRRLIRTVKTKIGSTIFSLLLQKGSETTQTLVNQMRQSQVGQSDIASALSQWEHLYSILYDQLITKLSLLFSTSVGTEYANGAPTEQIWNFFGMFALNANPHQRSEIAKELRPIIETAEQSPPLKWLLDILK